MEWRGGGLTRAQATKQRKQLMTEIEREHQRKNRETLAALRQQIAALRRRRREAMSHAVARCKKNRLAVRQHAKALRKEVFDRLRETIRQEREAARTACALRKERIRNTAARQTDKVKQMLRAERALQDELRRVEQRSKKAEHRTTARERQQESDDAVIRNIDPDLVALFQRVKRHIRGNDRMSRTEAFYRFIEENPEAVVEAMEELSQRELKRLLAEERRLAKTAGRRRRPRATAEELAAVPF